MRPADTLVPFDQYTNHKDAFSGRGFIGPIPLLTKAQGSFLARHLLTVPKNRTLWEKSLATVDPLAYETAANPELLRLLRALLGEDVILWGCSLVLRRPGEIHPWHCDVETCAPGGGFVSVWIGLLNTTKESSLCLIPGSHGYGASIQEVAARQGISRKDRTDEVALRLANSQHLGAEIVQPDAQDGEAIVFDGCLWHGSRNQLSETVRAALLLQYARADRQVKVPKTFEWPFRFDEENRPPAIVLSGRGDRGTNNLVAPPSMREPDAIGSRAHQINPHARCAEGVSFTPTPCFQGHTSNVDYLECHYSVLMPGGCPHLPHRHLDEEILVVMSGAGELIVANSPRDLNPKIIPALAGSAIYYPPFQHHTIRNTSSEPVRYAMLRWRSPAISAEKHLPPRFMPSTWLKAGARGEVAMKTVFEGPSAFLGKLHTHVTRIVPGGGYEAHRDAHDVSIFLIEGEITVLGKRISAPAAVFFPAGHLHDMKAVGAEPAKYVVWEFHRTESDHGRIPVFAQTHDRIEVH